jgi:hypothetical protein
MYQKGKEISGSIKDHPKCNVEIKKHPQKNSKGEEISGSVTSSSKV